MKKPQPSNRLAVDGQTRNIEADKRLNAVIVSVLGTDAGKEIMNYLESITIRAVNGPEVTDAQLRHLEGQRYIVGLLNTRIRQGHKEKSSG